MAKKLGKRIKLARIKAGLTQGELAGKLGIAHPTLSKYEQGHRIPDSVLLGQIARILECDPGWLLEDTGEKQEGRPSGSGMLPAVRIPVLNKVPSDFPERVSDRVVEYISLPDIPRGSYAFVVKGDGMSPTIRDGDYVVFIIDTDISNGDMIMVNNEWGEPLLKRYHKKGRETFLISDNPEYAAIRLNSRFKIIGKVIVAWRRIRI